MLKSNDGINWTKVPIDSNLTLIDFYYFNGKYYLLCYNSIEIMDSTGTVASIPYNSAKDTPSDVIVNDKRIMINHAYNTWETWKTDTYEHSDSIVVLKTPYFNGFNHISTDGNDIYVLCNRMICNSTDLGDTWNVVADSALCYAVDNHQVYRVAAEYDNKFNNQTTFRFDKLNKNKQWENISVTKYDCMARTLSFYDIKFIDSNNVVINGLDPHISVSHNGGKTWELKSAFNNIGISRWFNDTLGVNYSGKATIYKTTNGGITWLPNKISDSYKKYMEENKFGMDAYSYLDIDSSGLVLAIASRDDFFKKVVNLLISHDFGETYEAIIDTNLNAINWMRLQYEHKWEENRTIAVYEDDFKYKFITYDKNMQSLWKNTEIYYKVCGITKYNDAFYIIASRVDTVKNGSNISLYEKFSILKSLDTCQTWEKTYDLFSVVFKDSVLKIETYVAADFKKDRLELMVQTCVAFQSPNYAIECKYMEYNFISGEKNAECILDTNQNFTHENPISYKNYSIQFGQCSMLYQSNTDPICSWTEAPYGKEGCFSYNSTIGDYLYGYNDYGISKMRLKSLVSVNDKEDVEYDNSYLYIYPPYPNPAKNYVRAVLYWDSSAPIEYAKINIYNSNGDLVAGKNSTTLTELGMYRGILEWNCQGQPSGVYLIVITHGTNTQTIKCAVSR